MPYRHARSERARLSSAKRKRTARTPSPRKFTFALSGVLNFEDIIKSGQVRIVNPNTKSRASTTISRADEASSAGLLHLPYELTLEIFSYLERRDLLSLRSVNRFYRDVSSPFLFRKIRLFYDSSYIWGYFDSHLPHLNGTQPFPLKPSNIVSWWSRHPGQWCENDPVLRPINAIINSEHAPPSVLTSATELSIVLLEQTNYALSRLGISLMCFADYILPRMFKVMGCLRELYVDVEFRFETIEIVLYTLKTLCRLASSNDRDIDVHVRLIYGDNLTFYHKGNIVSGPSEVVEALEGIKSLSLEVYKSCEYDGYVENLAKLVERSPKMELPDDWWKVLKYEKESKVYSVGAPLKRETQRDGSPKFE